MPFLKVDWTRFGNSTDPTQVLEPGHIIQKLLKPVRFILVILGLHLGYPMPKKRTRRYLVYAHRTIACILALVVIIPVLLMFRFWSFAEMRVENAKAMSLTCLYIQAATSIIELIILGAQKRLNKFNKLLQIATTGVGVLRKHKPLTRGFYTLIGILAFFFILWTVYNVFAYFTPLLNWPNAVDNETCISQTPFNQLFFINELDPLAFAIMTYLLLSWFISQIYFFLYAAVVLVELRSLNDDLNSDPNLYQVPVLKHYLSIHFKLRKLLRHFNNSFGHFLLVYLSSAVLGLLIISSIFISRVSLPFESLITLSAAFTTFSIEIVVVTVLALIIEMQMNRIKTVVCSLTATDKSLDYEMFTLSNCYLQQFSTNHACLHLGGIITLRKRTVLWGTVGIAVIIMRMVYK